jgi:hypothetical protein
VGLLILVSLELWQLWPHRWQNRWGEIGCLVGVLVIANDLAEVGKQWLAGASTELWRDGKRAGSLR